MTTPCRPGGEGEARKTDKLAGVFHAMKTSSSPRIDWGERRALA